MSYDHHLELEVEIEGQYIKHIYQFAHANKYAACITYQNTYYTATKQVTPNPKLVQYRKHTTTYVHHASNNIQQGKSHTNY